MASFQTVFKTYQNVIISACIIIFCLVGVVAGVIPAVQKVQALIDQNSTLSAEKEALQKKLAGLSALDEASLRTQLDTLLSAVPSDQSLPTVFSSTEAVAAQTGVSITTMAISENTSLATSSASTAAPKQHASAELLSRLFEKTL